MLQPLYILRDLPVRHIGSPVPDTGMDFLVKAMVSHVEEVHGIEPHTHDPEGRAHHDGSSVREHGLAAETGGGDSKPVD